MRQLVSTALVALIVSALTVTVAGALAQEPAPTPPEDVVTAGLNADSVDGRHAVKATNKKTLRKNKLVAADAKGYLPSNIVKPKWGLVSQKPPAFVDGQIGWNEVVGIPAGFADGTDDVGYVSSTHPTTYSLSGTTTFIWVWAETPIGTDVELTLIPMGPDDVENLSLMEEVWESQPGGLYRRYYRVERYGTGDVDFRVRTRVLNTGIAPAAFKKAVRNTAVGVSTKGPRRRG